ncbi:PACE efflux transporter [Paracoccus sp. PAR01]|uniref:PACE efflux transporter n=1 Tax=Paracoccus sp. PAR01 TaxID=2769282 RepID=UPI0017803169|nr:PACE efflux transporter [Paracoccus sp. PAR01]MBD9525856.1 PACE efflux transporter [Paracoccus sp. PAR01]
MRKVGDRIRHALSFEILGLLIATPLGALLFHMPVHEMGVVALVGATIATTWNIIYNYVFDVILQRFTGTTLKSGVVRIFHAVLFEAGLLLMLLPFVMWYLGVTFWQALVMDISFAVFYMVYAFVFNWAYDRIFPLPEWQTASSSQRL